MSISEVLAFIKEKYAVAVSYQTVRNWMLKGRGGVCLPKTPTAANIKSFFAKVGTSFGRGRPVTAE